MTRPCDCCTIAKHAMITSLTLPWPPSVNRYWRNLQGRTLISADGRKYRTEVVASVLQQLRRLPRLSGRLGVVIMVTPPDKRRRDLDNLFKAILDSLTHAGVWMDDSQIDDLHIVRQAGIGGCVRVEVHSCG